jgi:hypothetical protein
MCPSGITTHVHSSLLRTEDKSQKNPHTQRRTYSRTTALTYDESPARDLDGSMSTPVGSTAIRSCNIGAFSLQLCLPPIVASRTAYGSNAGSMAARQASPVAGTAVVGCRRRRRL